MLALHVTLGIEDILSRDEKRVVFRGSNIKHTKK